MIYLLTTTKFYISPTSQHKIRHVIVGTLLFVEIVNKISINKRTKYIIEL